MNLRFMNLYLMAFWLILGIALFFRHDIFPETVKNPDYDQRLQLGSLLALVLAAWNLVRWRIGKTQQEAQATKHIVTALHKPLVRKPEVTDPQFQFDQLPAEVEAPPSMNGKTPHSPRQE